MWVGGNIMFLNKSNRGLSNMEVDIKGKIANVLTQNAYSERDVVYILVESYKFLERKYRKEFGNGKFDRIKFYRNWACHSVIDRASDKVFTGIAASIKAEMNKPNAVGHLDWQDQTATQIRQCFRGYSPLSLKEDILQFFPEIEYSGNFHWESFRASLYEIIRDIPLIIKDGDDILFEFKCVKPFQPMNYDDLSINAVIFNDIFSFVLDDRTL